MNDKTQVNALGAKEISDNADDLAKISVDLKGEVEYFKFQTVNFLLL